MSVSRSLAVSSGWLSGQRHFGLRLWYGSGGPVPETRTQPRANPLMAAFRIRSLAWPFLSFFSYLHGAQ